LLFVDRWFKNPAKTDENQITAGDAFKIGVFQCLALFPGVSRSAATIIGGLAQKLDRRTAAEFSFLLAVPTMFAATAKKFYDFYKDGIHIDKHQAVLLVFGNIIAFVVAMVAIRTFLTVLNKFGFRWFGVYRIIIGGILIIMFWLGIHPSAL